jgi:hypothetical protein
MFRPLEATFLKQKSDNDETKQTYTTRIIMGKLYVENTVREDTGQFLIVQLGKISGEVEVK